jgi:hypothetical protein
LVVVPDGLRPVLLLQADLLVAIVKQFVVLIWVISAQFRVDSAALLKSLLSTNNSDRMPILT